MTTIRELEGRPHFVIPMVMLTVGNHAGSNGPVHYPADELERSVPYWNQLSVVVYHPSLYGRGVSAGDPDILNRQKIGVIFNTSFDGQRLKADAWVDRERVYRVDERVAQAIAREQRMEVSTGLVMDFDEVHYNGAVATGRNFRPDHLAVLPDKIGACSLKDGCGLLRNEGDDIEYDHEDGLLLPSTEIAW
ncbi:hypothetical protein [Roseimaritima ulvae]|uniref:Uncharacterized protein n=1 Tax=Roseimaritima ulvae TaxID=980254 RepID=A0A5B9QPF8_9BACT|nr:hypothetical protein [Roseimaritima ulvae]QEG39395.1 hypothetical protein UC8_13720 [Roseimaritima ulvae]